MKEQILKLHNEGKSYNEIAAITGASKGTISYHISPKVKEKALNDQRKRRRNLIVNLKLELGGQCVWCGYNRCLDALDFHHIDPTQKSFSICKDRGKFGLPKLREEAKKCLLICSNCHREEHAKQRSSG